MTDETTQNPIDDDNNAPQDEVQTLVDTAIEACESGDFERAIGLWTQIIESPALPPEALIPAHFNRAISKGQIGDIEGEIADCTAVIEIPDATGEQKAMACINRGRAKGDTGDFEGEIDDYTIVIKSSDAPPEQLAAAYFNRGIAKGAVDDSEGEIADYTAVLAIPEIIGEQRADAYINRGSEKAQAGDFDAALEDYRAAAETPDALDEQKILAHSEPGWILYNIERYEESIAESQKALDMDPNFLVARNSLGLSLIASGQGEKGVEEFKALLDTAEDPFELDELSVPDLAEAAEKHPDIPEFQTALKILLTKLTELEQDLPE